MHKGYRYRIYPNKEQQAFFEKNFNACRLVYNLALETKIHAYRSYGVSLSAYDLNYQLTDLKKSSPWLKEAIANSLVFSIRNMDKAFLNFFKNSQSFPRFKSKRHKQSFTMSQGVGVNVECNRIIIPKCSPVKAKIYQPLVGTIKTATVSRTPAGRYFISFIADSGLSAPAKQPVVSSTAVGVDLGIKSHVTTSDNLTFNHIDISRSDSTYQRIQILKRRLRKKVKGSGKRKKLSLQIAKLYERQRNQRNDAIHKITSELVNSHDTICLETLRIKNMLKHPKLARSIQDSSLFTIVRQIEYKAEWRGKNVLRVPTNYPSTKTCSGCSKVVDSIPLGERVYRCNCGTELDRDWNAAINIKNEALRLYTGAGSPSEPVELSTRVGTLKRELSKAQPSVESQLLYQNCVKS